MGKIFINCSLASSSDLKCYKYYGSLYYFIVKILKIRYSSYLIKFNNYYLLANEQRSFVLSKDAVTIQLLPTGLNGRSSSLMAAAGLATTVSSFFTSNRFQAIGVIAGISVLATGLLGIPEPLSADKANILSQPSPTYNLQNNVARFNSPIPTIYGKHIIYPDHAMQPYIQIIGNDEYSCQLLCLGQGEYVVHNTRLGDSDVKNLSAITIRYYEKNAQIDLFGVDIITSDEVKGDVLNGSNNWSISNPYCGPYVSSPVGTKVRSIILDFEIPNGLFQSSAFGTTSSATINLTIQIRKIDDNNIPENNDFNIIGSPIISGKSYNILRRSFSYDLPEESRYEVRVGRTNKEFNTNTDADTILWTRLKSRINSRSQFGNLTLIAIKMPLVLGSDANSQINCVVTRKLPVWDPITGWSIPVQTRSVVWAICDILRSDYGAKLPDGKINLNSLAELNKELTVLNVTFNAVIDRQISTWEILQTAARSCRCSCVLVGGIFNVIRDKQQNLPVTMYSSRNIIKDSFMITYSMPTENTADGITLTYLDEEKSYRSLEVSISAENTVPNNPINVTLFGCTNVNQAKSEALYMARSNMYRRKIISFKTELEGFIPTFGDLILISHDMPEWGISGDVVGYSNEIIELSEDLISVSDKKYYIVFRLRNGQLTGLLEVIIVGSSKIKMKQDFVFIARKDSVFLRDNKNEFLLYFGSSEEKTQFSFGVGTDWNQYGVIREIKPQGNNIVELEVLSENKLVHEN